MRLSDSQRAERLAKLAQWRKSHPEGYKPTPEDIDRSVRASEALDGMWEQLPLPFGPTKPRDESGARIY